LSNQEKIGPENKKEEQLSIIINKSQIIENDNSKKTKNKREKKNDIKKKNEN